MREQIINSLKKAFQSARIAKIRPTGVFATRALVILLLVPILLVVLAYLWTFVRGYVSYDVGRLIDTGIKIIDHIFIPSVLASLVGFLALFVDRNGDGVPDRLEEPQRPSVLNTNERGEGKR